MRRKLYYVYLMSSPSRTLYIGVTNDLERRVQEHKSGAPGSFTARYHVTELVYFEEFDDINQAIARETELKRMTRRQKIRLIESTNPSWHDLSASAGAVESGIPRVAATRGNDTKRTEL
jgi:putative endonuclease